MLLRMFLSTFNIIGVLAMVIGMVIAVSTVMAYPATYTHSDIWQMHPERMGWAAISTLGGLIFYTLTLFLIIFCRDEPC